MEPHKLNPRIPKDLETVALKCLRKEVIPPWHELDRPFRTLKGKLERPGVFRSQGDLSPHAQGGVLEARVHPMANPVSFGVKGDWLVYSV